MKPIDDANTSNKKTNAVVTIRNHLGTFLQLTQHFEQLLWYYVGNIYVIGSGLGVKNM